MSFACISKKLFGLFVLASLAASPLSSAQSFDEISAHYADLASAVFSDSLILAESMQQEINTFLSDPSLSSLDAAKESWIEARKVYGISEVFRFSHPVVDDWEPQVNAWPLDEGLIDYVDNSNYFYDLGNPVGKANLIANQSIRMGSETIDLTTLTPELLASLNEIGGTEANVATGWHAIEFLLWGQDLNGTNSGAGERRYTDFSIGDNCTNSHCERRVDYLRQVTALLIRDLEFMVKEWSPQGQNYRAEFEAMPSDEKIRRILYGIGSLALGELAGERMKVALYANSPEDEHDCFSDTTHNTLYANAAGVAMAIDGEYKRVSGATLSGPSLMSWAESDSSIQEQLRTNSNAMLSSLQALVTSAESGEVFDQLIAPGNSAGKAKIDGAINSLRSLTISVEQLASAMELGVLNPDNAGHEF